MSSKPRRPLPARHVSRLLLGSGLILSPAIGAPVEGNFPDAIRSIGNTDPGVPQSEAPAAALLPSAELAGSKKEFMFIDAGVADPAAFLDAAHQDTVVIRIPTAGDPWQFMARAVADAHDLAAIHIVSHGEPGALIFNGRRHQTADLAKRSAILRKIGRSLKTNGDIFLYGCDTAAGGQGMKLVNALASFTGRDVAASDDRTGAGGDWDLEIRSGVIEAATPLSVPSYAHDLALRTVSSSADAGPGTLRQAIADAVAGDVITSDGARTILLTSPLVIGKNLTIDGDLNNDGTPDVTLDGQNRTRVLEISGGSTVNLDGLTITKGLAAGNGGASGQNLPAPTAKGGGISNSGNLTLSNTTVTQNRASGGGGGGGVIGGSVGGGGGGGGGFGGFGGGNGGGAGGYTPQVGGNGTGGFGAGYRSPSIMGGRGGSTTGGAGSTGSYSYSNGGAGGTANNSSGSIGGGGGGSGWDGIGGIGGSAVGGIYNASGATLTVIGISSITNNLAAGGGGGGGGGVTMNGLSGGAGGSGIGGIWNKGMVKITASNFAAMASNLGVSGSGGPTFGNGGTGTTPAATNNIFNAAGGVLDTTYSVNTAPVITNLNADSVAWAGVGNTVALDLGGDATISDAELGALNSGNGNWSGASLVLQRSGATVLSDVFGFNTSGSLFTVSGSNLQSGGLTFATFTNTLGVLSISFTGSGTPATTALVQDVTRRINYRSDTPAGDAALTFTLSDGTLTATATTTVTSDTIYITEAVDTTVINIANGVSFSEAIAIAAADVTGSQTIAIGNALGGQTISNGAASTLGETLTLDLGVPGGIALAGGTLSISAGVNLTVSTSTNRAATIIGAITGTGGLTKTGGGALTMSNNNTRSGATSIAGGILIISGGSAIADTSPVTIDDGATLQLLSNETIGNLSGTGSIDVGARILTTSSTANITFSGVISGTGGFAKSGSGILTLSGTNTYTGSTTITAGGLTLDGNTVIFDSSPVSVASVATLTVGAGGETIGSLAGSGSVVLGGALVTGGNNNSTTFSGVISNSSSSSVTKIGTGILSLSGSNTYSGGTTVSNGTLLIVSSANLGSGNLNLNGGELLAGNSLAINTPVNLGGSSTINSGANIVSLDGTIAGTGGFTKTGTGLLTLAGTNTYIGATTISDGSLGIASNSNLGIGSLTIGSTGVLSITGATAIDKAIALGSGATIQNSANVALSGALSGGGLKKSGNGVLTFSGSNTNTTTDVIEGTLAVTGNTLSTIAVSSGATLTGSGSSGAVTISSGGTLSLSSPFSINGAVTVSANGIATFVVTGAAQSGRIVTNGAVNLAGAVLNLAFPSYTPVQSDRFTFIDKVSTGAIFGTFLATAEGSKSTVSGVEFTASYLGGNGNDFTFSSGSAAPVIANLNGDSSPYNEGGAGVFIDGGSNATVTDSDSANFNNGSVRVAVTANGTAAEDVLSIANSGTAPGQIGISGANVTFGGNVIGSLSGGTNGVDLVISLNASATPAAVQALVRNLVYSNSNGLAPSTATRTIGVSVNDGAGGLSAPASVTISIIAVNHPPTAGATGGTPTFTENGAAVDLFSGVTVSTIEPGQAITGFALAVSNVTNGASEILRADGTNIALTDGNAGTTATNTLAYSVSLSGTTARVTFSKTAGISTAIAQTVIDGFAYQNTSENPGTTSRVVTLTNLSDNGGTANSGEDTTNPALSATVTLSPVNDAPTITAPTSIAATEDISTFLTGISFSDVDAGTASVTATLSVPSGSLAATSGSGVSVGNSGTSTLTLAGPITDINAFIAASKVSFLNALNATSSVSLSVGINDEGATGSGGAKSASASVILTVNAVNDAPVNTVPGPQTLNQNSPLTFNTANSNRISISDVDAGGNVLRITLGATNGTVALSGTSGLSFIVGSGTNDATMIFDGSLTDLNAALNNLVFTPTPGYNGPAALQMVTSDLGSTGSGGTKTATNTITLTVNSINPTVVSVKANANGTYKINDLIFLTVNFSEAITVDTTGGTPTLQLATGGTATYSGGSGTTALNFSYVVGPGQSSVDLDYSSTAALALNGSTLTGPGPQLPAFITLPTPGNPNSLAGQSAVVVDGIAPAIQSVAVPSNGTYGPGQNLNFTVNFSESVTVTGTPRIPLNLDAGGPAFANYLSGSGTSALTFRAVTAAGQSDSDGISVANAIDLNGGAVRDTAGNNASLVLNSVGSTTGVLIDTTAPTATIVVAKSLIGSGQTSLVTITFSERITNLDNGDFTVANGTLGPISSSNGGIVWTATFTPAAGVSASGNVITLKSGGVLDSAGNPNVGPTDSNAYTLDAQGPTATIVVADPELTAAETSLVTIIFSEPVTGFDNTDLAFTNGTLSSVTTANGGITWTAIFTPTAGVTSDTNAVTLAINRVVDSAGNANTSPFSSNNFIVRTKLPTSLIAIADTALKIGDTSLVTFTFSEAVTDFNNGDLTVPNATLSNVTTGDNGIIWTATLTPTANITAPANVITLDNTGVKNTSGNSGTGTIISDNYAIDTKAPTATIAVSPTALKAGQTATVTITFSETVTGLTLGALASPNGTFSGLGTSDNLVWTATFTPTANTTAATNAVSFPNSVVIDAAGNPGSGTATSDNFAIDTARPLILSIARSNPTPTNAASVDFTVTFNEAVSGVGPSDFFLVTDGSAVGTIASVSGSGTTYTLTVGSLGGRGNLAVAINGTTTNTGIVDASGNEFLASYAGETYLIDRVAPVIQSVAVPANRSYGLGQNLDFTVTFSEIVTVTGSPKLPVTFDVGGTIGASYVSGSGTSALVFRATVAAGQSDANGIVLGTAIELNGGTIKDEAANNSSVGLNGVGNTTGVLVDTAAPTANLLIAKSLIGSGQTSLVTVTFSEPITGLNNTGFTVGNGTLGTFTTTDNLVWTATFTPTAGVSASGNVITLKNASVNDSAGNPNAGPTDSNAYTLDAQGPTATIVLADLDLTAGETSLVTVTFSEPVTGFDNTDLAFGNGALTEVSTADSGTTWTATFTPAAEITSNTNAITLAVNKVSDSAGNPNTTVASSANFTIRTKRPTATIAIADTALKIGETSLVTFTFSEAVTDFDNSDLTVPNATLTGVSSGDNGITWTATLTPTANISAPVNAITLDNTRVKNAAGNLGTGTTVSLNYTIDTVAPAIAAVAVPANGSYKAGDVLTFTVSVSKAVTVDTTGGTPRLALTVGSANVFATYSTSTAEGLVFVHRILPGENDNNGIVLVTMQPNGGTLRDSSGNDLALPLNNVADTSGILIDTIAPDIAVFTQTSHSPAASGLNQSIEFTEPVKGVGTNDFEIVKTGTASYDAAITSWQISPPGNPYASKFFVSFIGLKGTGTISLALKSSGTGITDQAGNPLAGGSETFTYTVDRDAPAITSVGVPNPFTFKNGENIDLTVNFSEPVNITGSPTIAINLDHGGPIQAVYSGGSGSTAIDFRSTVGPDQADITGVTVTPLINLNGGTIKDTAGNDSSLALTNIADSSLVLVDSSPPVVAAAIPDQILILGETPKTIDLLPVFTDLGSTSLQYTVTANTDGSKATAVISGSTLTLTGAANGITRVTVEADDLHGGRVTDTFEIAVGTADPTPVTLATTGTFNPANGLFDFTVNVTNTTPRPINGFRLHVDFSAYLAAQPSLRLYNATLTTSPGIAYIDFPFPVAVDAVTAVKLTFYTGTRQFPNPFVPGLTVETLPSSQVTDTNGSGVQPRLVILPDSNRLLEFPSEIGKWYRVRYSADLVNWQDSPVPLQAGSTRMQWIDSGPPFTQSPPASVPARFYIVNEITAP